MKLISKTIFIFFLIFTNATVWAEENEKHEDEYSRLSMDKKCFVKSYQNGSYSDEEPKKFKNVRIFPKLHKKNDRYSLFKYDNRLFVVLTSCLDPGNIDETDKEELFDSENIENNDRINRAASRVNFSDSLRFNENKYFFGFSIGQATVSDKNQIFPYDELNGTDCVGSGTSTCNFGTPDKTAYKTGAVYSFDFGWKAETGRFWAIKFKTLTGSKDETVPIAISNGSTGEADYEFTDKLTSFLIGQKYIFWEQYQLKPVFALYLGFNTITSNVGRVSNTGIKKYKFESSGLSALAEAGFEFLFTPNWGISLVGGYEYLGTRTFRLKEKDETLDQGFRSKLSYSNTFATVGMNIYFQ